MTGIWGDRIIPILGLTGEHNSGKTHFGLHIDPERTICFDFEKSAVAYQSQLKFTHKDMRRIARLKYGPSPTPKQLFLAWQAELQEIEPEQYSVIMVDPITDTLDMGHTSYVASRFESYGFNSEYSFTSSKGIFWGHVKNNLENIILDQADRCETFCFTAHLKKVWKEGKATNLDTPKGKDTLRQLASLYLHLERRAPRPGFPAQKFPSALILSCKSLTCFPPRLPEASPDKIRFYLDNPRDYATLTEEEKVPEEQLTDAEKLIILAGIEDTKLSAANATLEAAKLQNKAADARAMALQRLNG